MQKEQDDQGLSFKKRARRRLVGAIALVLLMIIILPMVLEDREKSVQQEDIEIVMPNDSAETLDSVAIDSELSESSVVQPSITEDAVVMDEVEMPTVEVPPTEQPPIKAANVEQKKQDQSTEDKKTSVVKADSTTAAVTNNKYYVQIGVFSDPSNISKLQVKLSDLGYKSLTEKITTDTGVKTRLRTESFMGRNEAAIALENIKDAGLAGMVVNQK
jgi:DedD protein